MTDKLEPGTAIVPAHWIETEEGLHLWGYPDRCIWCQKGTHGDVNKVVYVVRHIPGVQVSVVDHDPNDWDEATQGKQRGWAIPDGAWILERAKTW